MNFTREHLLASVRGRSARSSLTTADRYCATLETCLQSAACPAELTNLIKMSDWQRELKEAETRFVYCAGHVATEHVAEDVDDSASPGGVLDLDAIVTTTRRDRDGDILESAGADVDPHAVLLWQHIPFQPIGKLVQVTEHTVDHVKARLSIADTELGRDAATLAAFGAVKISHGFEPRLFEPLPDSGWHIKRFEIFEVSLVSIPSNRDAVITAFSRRKLHSPLVRSWAQNMFDERPALVAGCEVGGERWPSKARDPGVCHCGKTAPGASSLAWARPDALDETCRRFIARVSLAEPEDAATLRQTHAVLGKVLEHVAPP